MTVSVTARSKLLGQTHYRSAVYTDALENAQSENTRRNYTGQYRKFRTWCEREDQSAQPGQPEVVAAYAAELAEDDKSMSTIRLAVAAIVDAHSRVGLESPQATGVTETLRGLSRQVGVSQKQARPLDADALAAIRATALNPRESRGGSLETEETAIRRGVGGFIGLVPSPLDDDTFDSYCS